MLMDQQMQIKLTKSNQTCITEEGKLGKDLEVIHSPGEKYHD
jgi:hypothetical protein